MNSLKLIQYVHFPPFPFLPSPLPPAFLRFAFPQTRIQSCANEQFFYGVDWASIRDIDAPFVPHLRSITDTSYFPTDEIDQTSDLPVGADAGDDAKKDLAFLGYTYVSLCSSFCPEFEVNRADVQVPSLRNALKALIFAQLYAPRSFTIMHVSVYNSAGIHRS